MFLIGVVPTSVAGRGPARSTPQVLVDLARDRGVRCQGKQSSADVLEIKTLLRAANRLDPENSQSLVWLYELATLAGESDKAAEYLGRLVAVNASKTTAFAQLLELGTPEIQTLEQRKAWLEGLIARNESAERRALLHTHLARVAIQQADRNQARDQLDQALSLRPDCPDAIMLELDLLTPDSPPVERLRVLLRALRLRPLEAELAWQAGMLLDECGLAEEAKPFYQYALDVHSKAAPGTPVPVELLLPLARNALARGDRKEATHHAQMAARYERGSRTREAAFFFHWLIKDRVPENMIKQRVGPLARQFAKMKELSEYPVGIIAQGAWFYCTIDPQPQRALLLAEEAARRAPGDVFTTRVLGWAQAQSGRNADAMETLIPIRTTDPYAAGRLAQLLREEGDAGAPARIISELEFIPSVGPARELLEELGLPPAASQPAADRFPEVARLAKEFDSDVFKVFSDKERLLKVGVRFVNPSPSTGEPWWLDVSLANRSDLPITLGADGTLNPVMLLSFTVEDQRRREYPNLLTISLDEARVILPGETIRVSRTVDLGPLRTLSRRMPQRLQTITMTAILDPELAADGSWRPSVAGQQLRPLSLVRLPANTGPEAWHARFSALKGDSPAARFQTLDVLCQLLGEQQRARRKNPGYELDPIPTEPIRRSLASALESGSWETRVRTLAALQVSGLDRTLLDGATRCLEHEHWAVRLMAVRLLARQGKAFADTAAGIIDNDADELVRDAARVYVQRWAAPRVDQAAGD